MVCKYLDATGRRLREGDVVLIDRPGADGKVIGRVVFNGRRGQWCVAVEKVFSASRQQFIPANPCAVTAYVVLAPFAGLVSNKCKRVEVLTGRFEGPRILPFEAPAPQV